MPTSLRTRTEFRPLEAPLGIEVVGADLSRPLGADEFRELKDAFEAHGVMIVRDQHLRPEELVAFSRRFGDLEIHVQRKFLLAGQPELLVVSNVVENGVPIGLGDAGHYWHSDLSYKAEPSMASFLHAREIPAGDGDTYFANLTQAYATLPRDLRDAVAGRTAIHDYAQRNAKMHAQGAVRPALDPAQVAAVPPVEHPVVRRHPGTGRNALFVNEGFTTRILGVEETESDALLQALFAHSVRPEFVYRHQWQPHDLVMWDNRSTIHRAAGCAPEKRRTLYRATIKGDRPIQAAA
jgi:taurine dioxygenase